MSHLQTVEIEMPDLPAIRAACKRLGWEFCEGQQTYQWYGSWVDDSPLPEALFTPEEAERIKAMSRDERCAFMMTVLGKCEHAIKVPGSEWEIGLVRSPRTGAWLPLWDYYDAGMMQAMGSDGAPLLQAYGIEWTKAEATAAGYYVTEEVLADGSVNVAMEDYA